MNFPYMSWRQAILKSDLPSTTLHVLLTLGCHMNDAGESCYPSIALLCEETGLSNRSVITHLQIAADKGWIISEKHGFAGKRWARNEYRITWPEVVKEVHCLEPEKTCEGGEGGSLPFDEGGEPNDIKVVKEVHTNSPKNSPVLFTNVNNTSVPSKVLLKVKPNIIFDTEEGLFTNIDSDTMQVWEEAYPNLNIDAELTRAELWYTSNPKKRKKNHQRFITGWLARAERNRTAPRFVPQPRRSKGAKPSA